VRAEVLLGLTVLASLPASHGLTAIRTSDASHTIAQTMPSTAMSVITDAIRAAAAGDTVRVPAAVYSGPTIVIDRPLMLIGERGAVLDGEGERALIEIRADNVIVRGLTFRNVGVSFVEDRAALRVTDARNCELLENRFEATFFAIYLEKVDGCQVRGNRVTGAGRRETMAGNGVHVWNSRNITITDNEVRGHRDGIYLEFVKQSRVEGNRSADNVRYGVHFMFSDSCQYLDNAFVRNGAGVAVMYARFVVMERNTFERNRGTATYGLLLKDIRDSRISGNRFIGNTVGLLADGSNRLAVKANTFRENGWAIKVLANATDNRFTDNVFVGNTFDVATNSRRSSSSFERNYWDAYRGYDLDGDGFGDVPFRPVRLFSLIVERYPTALSLLRSLFIDILDAAERVLPLLTPETLVDAEPRMGLP
jgi:nitrous oxidase accessory protein